MKTKTIHWIIAIGIVFIIMTQITCCHIVTNEIQSRGLKDVLSDIWEGEDESN